MPGTGVLWAENAMRRRRRLQIAAKDQKDHEDRWSANNR